MGNSICLFFPSMECVMAQRQSALMNKFNFCDCGFSVIFALASDCNM